MRGSKEGLLVVVRFSVLDKLGPVAFAKSLAHAALEPNAGLGLFEEGTPALGSAVAAELLHCMASWARCPGAAAAEAQQWQILFALHECPTAAFAAILGAVLMCAGLVVLLGTFECAKSGAKFGVGNLACARGALSSPRALGWQSAGLLGLLLSVPTAAAASLPLDGLPLDGSHASANLAWLQVGTWFPAQFWNTSTPGLYGVLMCKYDKAAIARDVATRAFDQPNMTTENCRSVEFDALKTLVDERLSDSCPVPEVSFIHHMPHAGSTLLTSMLESIEAVRTWS